MDWVVQMDIDLTSPNIIKEKKKKGKSIPAAIVLTTAMLYLHPLSRDFLPR